MKATSTLSRLLQFVEYLKRDRATIKQLAERFDMSQRTAYRYIKHIESAGISIDKDASQKWFIFESPEQSQNVNY